MKSQRLLFGFLLVTTLILANWVGTKYPWQVDVSRDQRHLLDETALQALQALDSLQITAFVPDLTVSRSRLQRILAPYLAAAPQSIRVEMIDPLQRPDLARHYGVSSNMELHLRSGQRLERVLEPSRTSIDLALNRLARRGEPWILSFTGHGEYALDGSPSGLSTLADRLGQLGYRILALDPRDLESLPENTAVLLLAAPRERYSAHIADLITRHVEAGGALLWLYEPGHLETLAQTLGLAAIPGIVVDASAAHHRLDSPDHAIVSQFPSELPGIQHGQEVAILSQATALHWQASDDWQLRGRLDSSPRSWNETGKLHGTVGRDPAAGELAGPLSVGLLLERIEGGRVAVIGSHQFLGNAQIGLGANLPLALGLIRWLSDNAALAPPSPTYDLEVRWSPMLAAGLALGLMLLLPVVYIAVGLWIRRRRQRR